MIEGKNYWRQRHLNFWGISISLLKPFHHKSFIQIQSKLAVIKGNGAMYSCKWDVGTYVVYLQKCFSWHSQHKKVLAEQSKTWLLRGNWTVFSISQCFFLTEWKPAGGQKGVAHVTVSCMGKSLAAQLPLQAKLALNRTKENRVDHILERCKCSSTCMEPYLFKKWSWVISLGEFQNSFHRPFQTIATGDGSDKLTLSSRSLKWKQVEELGSLTLCPVSDKL